MEVFDDIPVELGLEKVLKQLHLRRKNKYIERTVNEVIEVVLPIAKPKALYESSYVDKKNRDSLYIDDTKFTSRILRVNLDKVASQLAKEFFHTLRHAEQSWMR